MRELLVGLAIIAAGIAAWAIAMLFGRALIPAGPATKQPWEESLERTMKSSGTPETYVICNATHTMALCLASLTRAIEKFSASNERLSRINLLIVSVIAVATVVYAVASLIASR
jgi:hypothetical protein